MPRTHVIGAGLAGLSAAVSLLAQKHAVVLHEASGRAGGRCRSFADARLGCSIDNGNHLLLSGNQSTARYLSLIGAANALVGPKKACFPFFDVGSGRRWMLRPNAGIVPWWIFHPGRRTPGASAWSHLSALALMLAGPGRTVADCVGSRGVLFERFWEPLAVAALNMPATEGAAQLLQPVLRETFAKGEAACRPLIAARGLSDAFVDPALAWLRAQGAELQFKRRLTQIERSNERAETLCFGERRVRLGADDRVVLAVPPQAAAGLLPGLAAPLQSSPIVNVHFRLSQPADIPAQLPFLGLIGGTAQWLFIRGEVASVTISAAAGLVHESAAVLAERTWRDVAAALAANPASLPPYRVVKEKRATFVQTPEQARLRPGAASAFANVFLAGDWTATGLPATIESAVRSGEIAARAIVRQTRRPARRPPA
ncbi:MAG: hydroxysqualene dehydroxylase HpnE [Gammaproteobacteria bacterium]|nr:hydroxysqualene dehydroxylase HpnE [Gammaproteobacteria bacterium]